MLAPMDQQLAFFAPLQQPPLGVLGETIRSDFEEFWKIVPKNPNTSKTVSFTSYRKARYAGATAQEITDGAKRFKWSPDPNWRPYVSTWLNQSKYKYEARDDLSADAYGLIAWIESLPKDGTLSAAMYDTDDLRPILIATGWEPSWRGSLDVLSAWMRDGYVPDSVAKTIAAAVAEFGARGNLAAFDKRVRFRAERISL